MDDLSAGLKSRPQPEDQLLLDVVAESRARVSPLSFLYTAPWWLAILVTVGLILAFLIAADPLYSQIFSELKEGIAMTLRVTFSAYSVALFVGLTIALIRSNVPTPPKPGSGLLAIMMRTVRVAFYNAATLYVQLLRGLPVVVIVLIVAFVLQPRFREFLSTITGLDLRWWRGSSPESAILALAFAYGAFISETFRAGIQSIEKGQIEAARSLGMNYFQTTRYIVLPLAIRRVLPPLGNDLIAMIKDSALVAFLGVRDITQIAKTSSGRSFRYPETYLVLALIYLTMTQIGAVLVLALERYLKQHER